MNFTSMTVQFSRPFVYVVYSSLNINTDSVLGVNLPCWLQKMAAFLVSPSNFNKFVLLPGLNPYLKHVQSLLINLLYLSRINLNKTVKIK